MTVLVPLLALAFGPRVALSALIGAATATVANAVFALWVFGRYRAQRPDRVLMGLYGGEVLKLGVAVGLFVAAFTWIEPLSPVALLVAYLTVQVLTPLLAMRVAG